ncbi:hypothetical protein NP493_156g02002 [Ridgeia piscesae]|uniref:Uncharacterized protein n=1 Tax=Ridgeia piscesae TaxID=27915 RepID=A0AAD9P3Y7_RIDPI|nr:hypothetical protein NP493_156g02002 [Ridgeia piscesae]
MLKWVVSGSNLLTVPVDSCQSVRCHHVKSQSEPVDMQLVFARGSDPLLLTTRGKQHGTHSRLHNQIERELRLRVGAENLFKATSNKKLRETVAHELGCVNSNLQLLKEELANLNSPVSICQDFNAIKNVPMIPLGLKETKDVDMKPVFREYIKEHYHENSQGYTEALQQITDLRQAVQTPVRTETGVELLVNYYCQLYFIDKRFFPPDSRTYIQLEWFDSLTGVPSAQKTVGFEKGSILFNIGALQTQIAARQDRSCRDGTDAARRSFQEAAGAFKYLSENFSHAPSVDMQPPTLTMLIQLMLSQAQECMFEGIQLVGAQGSRRQHMSLAHESAKVSTEYQETHTQMLASVVRDYIPGAWLNMVEVKTYYFLALAHYHSALAIAGQAQTVDILAEQFASLHTQESGTSRTHCSLCNVWHQDNEQRMFIRSHLRSAILALEDALRLHKSCKQLRRIDTLQSMLKRSHDRCLQKFAEFDDEDDFTDPCPAPSVQPLTRSVATPILPDFSKYKVDDLFHELGPLNIFSARHKWTAPRCINLRRRSSDEEFGFSVRGQSPVIITAVENSSLAQRACMRAGDFITAVSYNDVKRGCHNEVISLIRAAGDNLTLHLVTPLDCNYLQPPVPCSPQVMTCMQSGTLNKGDTRVHRKSWTGGSWKLRKRRSKSREGKADRNIVANGKH